MIIKSVFRSTKPLFNKNTVSIHTQNALQNYNEKHYRVAMTKFITDYSLKGEIDYARKLFDQTSQKDSVTWNVMIKGYIQNNRIYDARNLFDEMSGKNSFSYSSMIMGYAREKRTHIALKLYLTLPCYDVVSGTAIVTALCMDSCVHDAWRLFLNMPEKNSISWSTIVSGFQQNGFCSKSLSVFKEMMLAGVEPTSHSFTSVLAACADLAMLSVSEQVYSQLVKRGFESNTHIGNSSISMFVKSGSFEYARRVFMGIREPNLVTWNSMIVGYGQYGYGVEAIGLFHEMQKASFLPDRISFLGVLQGCAHCGLVDEGKKYFQNMMSDYGVIAGHEHYATMADLFARRGMLREAYDTVIHMPYKPIPVFWRILLNGCRFSNNVALSFRFAEQVLKFEPCNLSALQMMTELNASAGRWDEVAQLRRQIRDKADVKQLGCSWIEIKGENHCFVTSGKTHPEFNRIYHTLELLLYNIAEQIGGQLDVPACTKKSISSLYYN